MSFAKGPEEEKEFCSKAININHFKLEKVIGRGSFGKVFMVRLKSTGELFAMKILKKDMVDQR